MPTEETMKAVRVHHHGGPDNLVFEDIPKPQPGTGQLVIRNEAAGVNFADVDQRRNNYPVQPPLPHILGSEFAGTVDSVGEGVTGLAVGDRVFGYTAEPSCYAQYVRATPQTAFPLPTDIGYAESTALLVQGLTAYFLLRDGARIAPGDSVLILAAAGGLGSLAVQLARIMGASTVIGAASTEVKRRMVSQLGADATIDYTQPNWGQQVFAATGGRGVDAALVNVGGDAFRESIGTLAPFGRLTAYGSADETLPVVDFGAEFQAGRLAANQTLGFFTLYPYLLFGDGSDVRSTLQELIDHRLNDRIRIQLGVQLPLSEAAEVHRLLESRQTSGKCVLLPWAD